MKTKILALGVATLCSGVLFAGCGSESEVEESKSAVEELTDYETNIYEEIIEFSSTMVVEDSLRVKKWYKMVSDEKEGIIQFSAENRDGEKGEFLTVYDLESVGDAVSAVESSLEDTFYEALSKDDREYFEKQSQKSTDRINRALIEYFEDRD